jgi:hypothetical protein
MCRMKISSIGEYGKWHKIEPISVKLQGALCRSMSPNFNFSNINVLRINSFLLQPWVVEVQSTVALPKDLQINSSIHQQKKLWAKRHCAFSVVHRPVLSHPPCRMASIPKETMGVCWLYFGLSRVSFVGDAVHYERTQSIWHAAHSVLRGARCGLTHPVTVRFMQNAIHSIFIFW